MDSNLPSSPSESGGGTKAAFRKPSNDAANRKYRRRSPVDGSSSSDGSPVRARKTSPIPSRDDPSKSVDDRRRKDDRRDSDREPTRSQYGRSDNSHRYNDRHYSGSSHNYHRHDDYKHGKFIDDDERSYHKKSSHSGRESRAGTHSDKYARGKTDASWHRSRERDRETSPVEYQRYKGRDSSPDTAGSGGRRLNCEELNSREHDRHRGKTNDDDDKREQRIVGDRKSDLSPAYESRGYRHDLTSRRDSSVRRSKESSRINDKDVDGQKHLKEETKKYDYRDSDRYKERYSRDPAEKSEGKTTLAREEQDCPSKKPKLPSLDGGKDHGGDGNLVSKFKTPVDERQNSNSQQAQGCVDKVNSDKDFVKDSDIDAAKIAAMKAAELVNRNLIGTGIMSADQKKKLLWGNKKSTAVEESTHRWDTSLFPDRERQEKFKKLMSLRLRWCLWPIVGCEGRAENGTQTREPGQQRGPDREAESTPTGFGEAIYCWTASKRRTYGWTGPLRIYFKISFIWVMNVSYILLRRNRYDDKFITSNLLNLNILHAEDCPVVVLRLFSVFASFLIYRILVYISGVSFLFK